MLKPRFFSTNTIDLTITRRSPPRYESGKKVEPKVTKIVIRANVQPFAKSSGTKFAKDEASIKKTCSVWSTSEIKQKSNNPPQQADMFVWEGDEYEVERVVKYSMGVLDHYEAQCVVVDPQ